MNLFAFILDDKKYTYIDSVTLNNKHYIAYMDKKNVYISEYTFDNKEIILNDVDDQTYNLVSKELNL